MALLSDGKVDMPVVCHPLILHRGRAYSREASSTFHYLNQDLHTRVSSLHSSPWSLFPSLWSSHLWFLGMAFWLLRSLGVCLLNLGFPSWNCWLIPPSQTFLRFSSSQSRSPWCSFQAVKCHPWTPSCRVERQHPDPSFEWWLWAKHRWHKCNTSRGNASSLKCLWTWSYSHLC